MLEPGSNTVLNFACRFDISKMLMVMPQQNVDSSARRSTRKKNCPRKKTLKKCWQGANFEIAIFSIKKTLKIFWQGANFEITTFSKRKQGANFVIAQPDCADRSNPLEDVTIVTLPAGRRGRSIPTFKKQILSCIEEIFPLLGNKYCLAFIWNAKQISEAIILWKISHC